MFSAALGTLVFVSAIFGHMTKTVAFIATRRFRDELTNSKV